MTSKQSSTTTTTTGPIQTRYYRSIDTSLNSSYSPYMSVSNRSYHHISLPYASNAYGVYRRMPAQFKGPFSLYPNVNRRIHLRNRVQSRQLSSEDYRIRNHFIDTTANDEKNSRDIFNYTYHHLNVSAIVFGSTIEILLLLLPSRYIWRYLCLAERPFFFRADKQADSSSPSIEMTKECYSFIALFLVLSEEQERDFASLNLPGDT